jgi:hypothetical protein
VFTVYEHKDKLLQYKESMESTEILSSMKVRSYFDQHLELQHRNDYIDVEGGVAPIDANEEDYVEKEDETSKKKVLKKVTRSFLFTDDDIMQKFKELSVADLMSYNTVHRRTLLFSVVIYGKVDIVSKLISMLENLKTAEVPFLFPEITKQTVSTSAFDIAIKKNGMRSIV